MSTLVSSRPDLAHDLYRHAGSEASIRDRQRKFVPRFQDAPGTVVDLGSGRGIFLDLLAAGGIPALGVDGSAVAVAEARRRGHAVEHALVTDFLAGAAASGQRYGGIFCSQLIEHFDGEEALALVRACSEVLASGGRLILVTPNPANLLVIRESFWLDLTHRRPYPRALLGQMLEECGLEVEALGDDPETRPRPSTVGPLRYWAGRILLREAYTQGIDLFAVGCKP